MHGLQAQMSNTQHEATGGSDTKANGKRKPELDMTSSQRAPKLAKKESKKKSDCPACGLKDDEVPDDGVHGDKFCGACRTQWNAYFCDRCGLFFEHELQDDTDLCLTCRKESCPECGKCDACGEHYSKKYPESTHVCLEEEEEAPDAKLAKCAICGHGNGSAGFCWQQHNICAGKCSQPNEICRCIMLDVDEERLISQFHLSAELNNVKYGNVVMGPDWEKLLEHAKKVVKMVETNVEAQRVLRAHYRK